MSLLLRKVLVLSLFAFCFSEVVLAEEAKLDEESMSAIKTYSELSTKPNKSAADQAELQRVESHPSVIMLKIVEKMLAEKVKRMKVKKEAEREKMPAHRLKKPKRPDSHNPKLAGGDSLVLHKCTVDGKCELVPYDSPTVGHFCGGGAPEPGATTGSTSGVHDEGTATPTFDVEVSP